MSIPRFTRQITSADGAVTLTGNKGVCIKAVNGDATMTDLDEMNDLGVSSDSALKAKTLYEGVEYYGRFTKIHVATGTVVYYMQ